jgi:hypothetical protein
MFTIDLDMEGIFADSMAHAVFAETLASISRIHNSIFYFVEIAFYHFEEVIDSFGGFIPNPEEFLFFLGQEVVRPVNRESIGLRFF